MVCSKSLANLLESDPTGILRHKVSVMRFRALESLPAALKTRMRIEAQSSPVVVHCQRQRVPIQVTTDVGGDKSFLDYRGV
jgi:hypothetical protein